MKGINSDMLLIGAMVMVAACCVAACLKAPAKVAPLGVEREDATAMAGGASDSSSRLGKSSDAADKAKEVGSGVLFIVLIVAVIALKQRFLPHYPLLIPPVLSVVDGCGSASRSHSQTLIF